MTQSQVISQQIPSTEVTPEKKAGHLFTGSLAVMVLALFMGFIFNRAMPINEGWFYYYSWLMHKGEVPYRDFWFFTQPYTLFVSWLFAGDHMINLRIYGLIERITLSCMLYYLLSRQFSAKASFLGTLVAMVMLVNYFTEGFFTFLVDSLTFFVAGLIFVYEAQVRSRRENGFFFLAGVFGSLSFFAKQSTGFFATLAMIILIAWPPAKLRLRIRRLVRFSIGWCVAAAPIVAWLAMKGALSAYAFEVFKGAAESKGSLKMIFLTTVQRAVLPKDLALFAFIAALLALGVWKKYLFFRNPGNVISTKSDIALTALLALLALFVPVLVHVDEGAINTMRRYVLVSGKLIFLATALLVAWLVVYRFRLQKWVGHSVSAILLIGGLLWAYGAQLSYRVEQHAIILGLGYMVAAACDNLSSRTGRSFVGIVTALCLLEVAETSLYKYNDAYDWNGWRSTIRLNYSIKSHWPQLAGFRFDGQSVAMFDEILDDIQRDAKPGEPIFTFPAIPMFNFITGHPQPTFAPVHYWDVCPDAIAAADAARVRAARPAVIVEMDMPEWLWQISEAAFRSGRRSAQRKIQAVIKEFTASGDYKLQDTFLTPWVHTRVNVWQRIR